MALTALAPSPDAAASRPDLWQTSRSQEIWLGWILALAATVGFSVAPPISRGAIVAGADPTILVMVRMVGAAILIGLTLLFTAPQRLKTDRHGLFYALLAGAVNGIGFLAFFWALERMEASIASMLFSINPLFVLGLLAWRGERLTRRHISRLALGLIGAYLLIGPTGRVDWLGVVWVLLTVLCFAVQLVFIQWYLQDYDAQTVTFYMVVGIALVTVVGWLVLRPAWRDLGSQGWVAVAVLIVVSTYLARLALFGGVRRLGSGQMALLVPLETLLTVIWAFLFLGERLTVAQWAGSVAIFGSLMMANRRWRRLGGRPRPRLWGRL
ncbi:MAG: DMT family transporter [Candidatus Promineifilaceae bacterium]|nr:DMT family transporter [Candidatus Promineifilaceae bacterium]